MDPTMQSPFRRTIPVPPPFSLLPPLSDGIEVTLPSGPHHYSVKNWVGSISQGNTPQQAFDALLPRAAPFQSGPSVDGTVINIPGFGPVRQLVDPDRLTIVNTTQPGHLLHPGNVFRSIVQEGDNLYVATQGYGTGVFPSQNEHAAGLTWKLPDLEIRRELNPYTPLGYPMDEMNAAASISNQSDATSPGNTMSPVLGSGRSSQTGVEPSNLMQPAPLLPWTDGRPGPSNNQPVRSLSRVSGNNSPAFGFGPSAPTTQFALPERLKSTSGIANWIAALAGVDPQNPTQAASSPLDDLLRGCYVDDPLQPWLIQRPR